MQYGTFELLLVHLPKIGLEILQKNMGCHGNRHPSVEMTTSGSSTLLYTFILPKIVMEIQLVFMLKIETITMFSILKHTFHRNTSSLHFIFDHH